MSVSRHCASAYLAFRHVTAGGPAWREAAAVRAPTSVDGVRIGVRTQADILSALKQIVGGACRQRDAGLLLSGGIDSAILAALMPSGSRAYTIRFDADGGFDESEQAGRYAERYGLDHRVVTVGWQDYSSFMALLMAHKGSPLHAVEVGLYKAGLAARSDGVRTLLVGNGADSNFGGLDKLLSRDWSFEEFVERYTFLAPEAVLAQPVSMRPVYERYRTTTGVDLLRFLNEVHGWGIAEAFESAVGCSGCQLVTPYETLRLDVPLDIGRIRRGESKYLLRGLFSELYPGLAPPEKVAFARPMDRWLEHWPGPSRPEFRPDIALDRLSGEQRWLLYCLERFLDLLAAEDD